MKICSTCKTEKTLDEFGNNKSREDGKQRYCKLFAKDTNAKYYLRYPERRREYNDKQRALTQQFIWDYLKEHPCSDCSENDPVVLQFDHVRGQKLFNIGEACGKGFALDKVIAEIEKCDVRCANCHIRQTASRGKWYQHIDTD